MIRRVTMTGIDTCLSRNAEYATDFSSGHLPAAPAMKIAIVTCMDARLETGAMLGIAAGDAHVIRNAGGIVTDDVIRSLTISQNVMETREIMVIQHTGCGMLRATEDELQDVIERKSGVRPHFALGVFSDLEDSVRGSVDRITASPLIPHTDVVRGFVYEVETGRLREVR